MQYKVVFETEIKNLELRVNALLAEGWTLFGTLSVIMTDDCYNTWYHQVLTLDEKEST